MITRGSQTRLVREHALEQEDRDSSRTTRTTERLSLYWLTTAAVLAIGNALLPIWFASSPLVGVARDGVRLNLLTLALALAFSIGIGLIWPRWWLRAMAILAVGPVPVLLVTSNNIAAGSATLLLVFVTSWLGRELVAKFLGELDPVAAWAIGATIGLGLIATFGFVAGTLGILRAHTTWALLLITAIWLLVAARERLRRESLVATIWLHQPAARPLWHYLLAGAALACFWLNLLGALAPEIQSDAVRQRLAAAAQFARNGNLAHTDPDLFVVKEPALGEMTYAVAITIGSLQAAKLLHFIVGLLCTAAIFALAARLGGRFAGGLAALAFYCTLITAWLSQSAQLDLFTTLFALIAALLMVLRPRLDWRAAAFAGICIGLGVAVKLHFAYVAVGLGVTAGLIAARESSPRRAAWLVTVMTGSAILPASPWLARAYALTGEIPGVALGTASLTTSTGEEAAVLFDLKTFGIGRALWDLLLLPLTTTLVGNRFGGDQFDQRVLGGHFGYLLLGFIPLVFFIRRDRRAVALCAGAAVSTTLWFYTAQYLRYGLPIIAIFLALAAVAYAEMQRSMTTPSQRGIGSVFLCILLLSGVAVRLQSPDIAHRYAFGQQSHEAFLDAHVNTYKVLSQLDSQPGVTRILVMWDGPRLYSNVRLSTPYTSAFALKDEESDEVTMQHLRDGGFSHILLDRRAASVPWYGWDRLTITNEDFLQHHTALVAGDQYVYLYRILSPEELATTPAWAQGRELLPNGSFEQAATGQPTGWHLSGNPHYDQSGAHARSGARAVRASPADSLSTIVAVQPGQTYLLAGANHGIADLGLVEMQIEWRDGNAQPLAVSGEKVIASPRGYRAYSILAVAPDGASATHTTSTTASR
jgi:hypothetical protein